MKILHISTSLSDGGAESLLYNLINYQGGHDHLVINLSAPGKYSDKLSAINVPVVSLNINSYASLFAGFTSAKLCLKTFNPLIIHCWLYHANIFGFFLRISSYMHKQTKLVWSIHNASVNPFHHKLPLFLLILFGSIISHLKAVDKIVFCSEVGLKNHRIIGYKKKTCIFIPNGYDHAKFIIPVPPPKLIRAEYMLDNSVFLIGMVARADPIKNHLLLIDAAHNLKCISNLDMRFVLIGNGITTSPSILKRIEALRLSHAFILIDSVDNVQDYIQEFDISCLVSKTEAFPNVLCESMLCGVFCLSTRVGDSELILGGLGRLVSRSISAWPLAHSLLDCLLITRFRSSDMKSKYRASIYNRFSLELMSQRYAQLWGKIAAL